MGDLGEVHARIDRAFAGQNARLDRIVRDCAAARASTSATKEKCDELCTRLESVEKDVGKLSTAEKVRSVKDRLALGGIGTVGGGLGWILVHFAQKLFT